MLNWFKNLFNKKESIVIDANIELEVYNLSVTPEGKLIVETETHIAVIKGAGELSYYQKLNYGFPDKAIVLDLTFENNIKEKY